MNRVVIKSNRLLILNEKNEEIAMVYVNHRSGFDTARVFAAAFEMKSVLETITITN